MKSINYAKTNEVVYYEKLANGLEVFMYPMKNAKNFYLTFNVKFGSMDTEFKTGRSKKFTKVPDGTAHFLEHQMFQEEDGTAFEKFSTLGSSVNAFTTYNQTAYEVISSMYFKENLNLLLDYVQNPVFKAPSVNKEKGIIKEEIKMYDNTPMSVLNFGLEYNLNQVDRHKYLISGTEEDIKEITPEILNTCYQAFYNPNNMFLVITGKFNPHEALGIIKENQSKKTFLSPFKITKKVPHEPIEVEKKFEKRELDVSIPKLKIAYKIDKSLFKGLEDIEIKVYLDAILQAKFGPTSDLLEKMINENLILYEMYATREIRDDYVLISIETETEYKEEVIELIRQELKSIKLSKEETERMKRINIANFIMHFDDFIAVAEDIEDDVIYNNRIMDNILEVYNNMTTLTINKIASLINTKHECIYFIDRPSTQKN